MTGISENTVREIIAEETERVLERTLSKAITEAIQAANCKSCCATCDLKPGAHRDDHQFIYELRSALKEGRKTALATIVKLGTLAVLAGLAMYFGIKITK